MGPKASDAVRWVAFLKGINVGGHTVKMDHLRELIAEVKVDGRGLEAVETYIASGNVVFSAPATDRRKLEVEIAAHLENSLGFPVPAFVRTLDELAVIAANRPFPGTHFTKDGTSLYIAFLPGPPDSETAKRVEAAGNEADRFKIDRSELYWLCATRFSDSPFSGPALEKLLAVQATVRNSATVMKMADRFAG